MRLILEALGDWLKLLNQYLIRNIEHLLCQRQFFRVRHAFFTTDIERRKTERFVEIPNLVVKSTQTVQMLGKGSDVAPGDRARKRRG